MISTKYYRLADYKIIEGEGGDLWWETHSGFCSVKIGRCFVSGCILFIEPGHTSEESGFLKGEFLDQLNRLSKWRKTSYYCTNFKIIKCKAYQKRKSLSWNNKYPHPTIQEDISYRLSRYEIIEQKDDKLLWRSYSGLRTVKIGKCFVNGNVMFLGRGEVEESEIKREDFRSRLSLLPVWEKTRYFCQQYTLYNCNTNSICHELDQNILSAESGNDTVFFRKSFPWIEPQEKAEILTGRFLKSNLKLFFEACVLGGKRLLNSILKLLN